MPVHQRPRPAPDGGDEHASTQAGSLRHGERLQPGLTQRDMCVMRGLLPRTPTPHSAPAHRAMHLVVYYMLDEADTTVRISRC